MNDQNRTRLYVSIGLGMLAGAALGYLLGTEEGRKGLTEVWNNLDDVKENLQKTGQAFAEQISENAQSGQQWIESTAKDLRDRGQEVLSMNGKSNGTHA